METARDQYTAAKLMRNTIMDVIPAAEGYILTSLPRRAPHDQDEFGDNVDKLNVLEGCHTRRPFPRHKPEPSYLKVVVPV